MNTTIKASLVLVAAVALLSVAVFALGLHRNFVVGQYVFLVGAIALNVGVVYWALARDAAAKGYGAQLLSALGIGLIAGFLIVIVSWGLTAFVFPDSLDEMKAGAITYMQEQGMAEDEYRKQLETLEKTTPMSQAIPGGVGTLFTSLVSGAVIAAFKRRKTAA